MFLGVWKWPKGEVGDVVCLLILGPFGVELWWDHCYRVLRNCCVGEERGIASERDRERERTRAATLCWYWASTEILEWMRYVYMNILDMCTYIYLCVCLCVCVCVYIYCIYIHAYLQTCSDNTHKNKIWCRAPQAKVTTNWVLSLTKEFSSNVP